MIAGEIGLKLPAMWKGLSLAALVSSLGPPVIAQEAGWHYSPYSGEGDRAALGCAYASTRTDYTCVAVRCEDDMSVGLYVHTGRLGGDAGRWLLQIDDARHEITADAVDGSPYGARVTGDIEGLLFEIKNGGAIFVDPLDGQPVGRNGITLSGSLYVINQALYFCAPPASATEPAT